MLIRVSFQVWKSSGVNRWQKMRPDTEMETEDHLRAQLIGITKQPKNVYARFYQLGINLGIANPRSEDNPRFILGSSFSVLSTISNLGITNLGITRLSL